MKNRILNLTQHRATGEQIADGVENIPSRLAKELENLLTFKADYSLTDLVTSAKALARLAHSLGYEQVMIGGLPSLMKHLEAELIALDISVGYARTERVSIDKPLPDGSGTQKVSVFKYCGMYWAWQANPCPYCKSTTCGVVTRGDTLCG